MRRPECAPPQSFSIEFSRTWAVLLLLCLPSLVGCWAPLYSAGISANCLSDEFRIPRRTAGQPVNLARLTINPPDDYLLGPNDVLEVTVPGLYAGAETTPLKTQIMASGRIQLPLVGSVQVDGMNLLQAQQAINAAYEDGFLKQPRLASVTILERSSVSVLVLGEVVRAGIHILPKYENDIGHALAAAGGITQEAGDIIEVHTHREGDVSLQTQPMQAHSSQTSQPMHAYPVPPMPGQPGKSGNPWNNTATLPAPTVPGSVTRIPLRGLAPDKLSREDVILEAGDVVMVPSRRHEVFYVVGRLSQTNTVRFTVGDRERELGVGFILPRDREIDVVTAVAMAGYIDPIDSPTTVTVHRVMPDGKPLLIRVDLIAARSDPRATVLVEPGDIIYLNPDRAWYFRRTIDRVIGDLFLLPYARLFR